MIGRVSGPVITLKLRDFQVSRERCLHDFDVKRWIAIELIVWH